jgi:bud site selection protein 31
MPKIKTLKSKRAPKGWETIEPTLTELYQEMRDSENEPIEGKRKPETVWPIFRINHQMSKYVFDLFYKKKDISRELYEYCLREKWADQNLIAKWKKSGYERLCCLQCINKSDSQFGTGCICRVPKDQLDEDQAVECVKCGCRGCASGDL